MQLQFSCLLFYSQTADYNTMQHLQEWGVLGVLGHVDA